MHRAKYLIPSLLYLGLGCGGSSHKKGKNEPVNAPVTDVNPLPNPNPTPSTTPIPTLGPTNPSPDHTPTSTSTPNPVPAPVNPGYVTTEIFGDSKLTILVKGLPENPIIVVDDVTETVKIRPEFEVRGADGTILHPSEFVAYMTISNRLSYATDVEFADKYLQIEEIDFFVEDKITRNSLAHAEFRVMKVSKQLQAAAWDYYQHIATYKYAIKESKLLLLKLHANGKEWLDAYLDAFDFYYGLSNLGESARAFATNVGTKKEPAAWLSFFKQAFLYYYSVSTSMQESHEFAEKAADQGKTQSWLDVYKEAYEAHFKRTNSASAAHQFASKAADKTKGMEWLKVYVDAFDFSYKVTTSERLSTRFAEKVADKNYGAAWLSVYKIIYNDQIANGNSHNGANAAAETEANRRHPD